MRSRSPRAGGVADGVRCRRRRRAGDGLAGGEPSPSATASDSPSPTLEVSAARRAQRSPDRSAARHPPWLGKRVLPRTADGFGEVRRTPPELDQRRFTLPDQLPALPGTGFASRVTSPAPSQVIARSTWKQACPVAAGDLSWVRLAFCGFDGRRHTGELLVNRSVADDLVDGVPAALRRAVPDRGDADHPRRGAGRSAHRRRQQHRRVRLPADDRRRRRTPSTPTAWRST